MAGINQSLITIPEMKSFEEVRQALAQAINQLQANIANQLPVTNMQGKRLQNVGTPQSADDAVTLKFLQSGAQPVQPVPANVGTSTGAFATESRVTFFFSQLSSLGETSHVRVPGTEGLFSFISLDANAVGTSTGSAMKFDVQVSVDDSTWTSILASPIQIPVSTKYATTVTTFTTGQVSAGNWIRAQVASGSDLGGSQINLELTVSSAVASGSGSLSPGPTINFEDDETPTGLVNGTNTSYTLAHSPSPTTGLNLFLNGVWQIQNTDYTLSGSTISMTGAPITGDFIRASYRY